MMYVCSGATMWCIEEPEIAILNHINKNNNNNDNNRAITWATHTPNRARMHEARARALIDLAVAYIRIIFAWCGRCENNESIEAYVRIIYNIIINILRSVFLPQFLLLLLFVVAVDVAVLSADTARRADVPSIIPLGSITHTWAHTLAAADEKHTTPGTKYNEPLTKCLAPSTLCVRYTHTSSPRVETMAKLDFVRNHFFTHFDNMSVGRTP